MDDQVFLFPEPHLCAVLISHFVQGIQALGVFGSLVCWGVSFLSLGFGVLDFWFTLLTLWNFGKVDVVGSLRSFGVVGPGL